MITVHAPESKRFMLILMGFEEENLLEIIDNIEANIFNIQFEQNCKMIKITCYGEYLGHVYPIVYLSSIKGNIWVYEYHFQASYVINNYVHKESKLSDIRYMVDVLYQTGFISFREAISVLLRKRIFRLDEERISNLLEIQGSTVIVN